MSDSLDQNICIKIYKPDPISNAPTPAPSDQKYRSRELRKCRQGKQRNSILFRVIMHSSISQFQLSQACFSFCSFSSASLPSIGSYLPYMATKQPQRGIAYIRKNVYHDKLWGEFSLGVNLTVEVVILFDPVHWTNRNGQPVISPRTVVISYDQLIHKIDEFSRLLLVDLLIRFRIVPFHGDHQLLAVLIRDFPDGLEEVFHAEGVLVVGRDEGGREIQALVVWIGVDVINVLHDLGVLFFLGGGEEEDISLHAVHKQTRDYLNLRIGLFNSHQVLLTVVLAGIEDHSLSPILHVLLEVIVTRHEVIKLLHVLKRQLDAALPPWCHEEHRLSLEVLDILIAEGFVVIVLEDLEAVGGLEFAIVQGFEADCSCKAEEGQYHQQLRYLLFHVFNYTCHGFKLRCKKCGEIRKGWMTV